MRNGCSRMAAYYNENDPLTAKWLRGLIQAKLVTEGDVDTRSIADVHPTDLQGYTQCHFFAGIGGWAYALRLAGWPDDQQIWTGSCPCQPFSSASHGKGGNESSEKHLWPFWAPLIYASRPRIVFGEQVATAKGWFDSVCDDMEAMGYQVGAAVLPACSVGQDHERYRLYFVGDSDRNRESSMSFHAETPRVSRGSRVPRKLAKAYGVSRRVALRGYGNAIVPQVAAQFVEAYLDTR